MAEKKAAERKFIQGKYTPAQGKLNDAYNKKAYESVFIRVRKDSDMTKSVIEDAARKAGESLNNYVLEAVRRRIAEDKVE